jgi:hypothetical protein
MFILRDAIAAALAGGTAAAARHAATSALLASTPSKSSITYGTPSGCATPAVVDTELAASNSAPIDDVIIIKYEPTSQCGAQVLQLPHSRTYSMTYKSRVARLGVPARSGFRGEGLTHG